MKPGSIQEFPEDIRDLFFRNPWTVILDDNSIVIVVLLYFNVNIGKKISFFGCVKGIIDSFFDSGYERSGATIEPEHLFVLLKKLGNRDLTLGFRKLISDISFPERRL